MKFKLILFATLLLGSMACTERICPTYTQIEIDTAEVDQKDVQAKP